MTSIYSGSLYNNFVKDNNFLRLENFDVNRFSRTVTQQADQGLREEALRQGYEYQQAVLADLTTKMNEAVEKLTNLYRRYVENQAAFRKVSQEENYRDTSKYLNALPDVSTSTAGQYPVGPDGEEILPWDNYDRIRNYTYNPFFGSKAVDMSDTSLNRTFWTEPGETLENAYTENGAFWSTISYLWGWDIDRINAVYATTDDSLEGGSNVKQINVTALQPNKPQYPPLRQGDRFPIYTGDPASFPGYPAIMIDGIRPGGVDYSHATNSLNSGGDTNSSANLNVVGHNSVNFGWEFDDLPLALQVDKIQTLPDGTTVPLSYKVVYSIPPTHPHYAQLKILDGTEPQIIDAPTEMRKDRIENPGFQYTGFVYIPSSKQVSVDISPTFTASGYLNSGEVPYQDAENEYVAPKVYNLNQPAAVIELDACVPVNINDNTRVSFDFKFNLHQNSGVFGSPGDDYGPNIPRRTNFSTHDWNSDGLQSYDGSGRNFLAPWPSEYQTITYAAAGPSNLIYLDTHIDPAIRRQNAGRDYWDLDTNAASPTDYNPEGNEVERIAIKLVPHPTDSTKVLAQIFLAGDFNKMDFEISNLQITSYTGRDLNDPAATGQLNDGNGWDQGLFTENVNNAGTRANPIDVLEGDPTYQQVLPLNPNNPYTGDVISKYYPGVYQFTQFNDQYNNSMTSGDMNNIVRSPWEFAQLNIGAGSKLSGELWIDINGRRLNFDHDYLASMIPGWNSFIAASNAGFDFLDPTLGVANAWQFIQVEHPDDDCPPIAETTASGKNAAGNVLYVNSVSGFVVGDTVVVGGQTHVIEELYYRPGQAATPAGYEPQNSATSPYPPIYRGAYNYLNNPGSDPYPPGGNNPFAPGFYEYPGAGPQTQFANPAYVDPTTTPSEPEFLYFKLWPANPLAPDSPTTQPHPGASYPVDSDAFRRAYVYVAEVPSSTSTYVIRLNGNYTGAVPAQVVAQYAPNDPRLNHSAQYADSDPLLHHLLRNLLLHDEILEGELPFDPSILFGTDSDPLRTDNRVNDPRTPANDSTLVDAHGNPNWAAILNFYAQFGYSVPYGLGTSSTENSGHHFELGTSNDGQYTQGTNTVDRILGSDTGLKPTGELYGGIQYKITIPTNDVNVLRNENNLLFNFGSIAARDWATEIVNPFIEMRTVPNYTTVPRYIVDGGGNIFDRFGYDAHYGNSTADQQAKSRLYTYGDNVSATISRNGQVSNDDGVYGTYDTTYADAASYEEWIRNHDRLSMQGDDYNLFDYVPDLKALPGTDDRYYGETFVGALPSNFYYYRETLDRSTIGGTTNANLPTGNPTLDANGNLVTTGGTVQYSFNNDNRAALNFDGRSSNLTGQYNSAHTYVTNTNMPAFANVAIGATERDAKITNQGKKTSGAVWLDFPGLTSPESYARAVGPGTNNVQDPINAIGQNIEVATMGFNAAPGVDSTLVLDMGRVINQGGYLVINEVDANGNFAPHSIPLPLLNIPPDGTPPYPSYATSPGSFTFQSYGSASMTRTGSRTYTNLGTQMLDLLDGRSDNGTINNTTARNLLTAGGYEVSVAQGPDYWVGKEGIVLHVDDAAQFQIEPPFNRVVLGTNGQEFNVVAKNPTNNPQTLILIPVAGAPVDAAFRGSIGSDHTQWIHTDLPVRSITGSATVTPVNANNQPAADGTFIRIEYDDLGTLQPLKIASVAISDLADRVGRDTLDGTTTGQIGPETFENPKGYVQMDAQMALNLVSQDKDGNQVPRKLKSVTVQVKSGEQLIPSNLQQSYTTYGPFEYDDGVGNWPIALFEKETQINPLATDDINYLVGFYQGIDTISNDLLTFGMASVEGFREGQTITINGETRTIAEINGNDLVLDEPLLKRPVRGDHVSIGNGFGTQNLSMYLNRSLAMSVNAGINIVLEYEEYRVVGYPPRVDMTNPVPVTENIGFGSDLANAQMSITPGQTGDGVTAPLVVNDTADVQKYSTLLATKQAAGEPLIVNINGYTREIVGVDVANHQLTLNRALDPIPYSGNINMIDYEDYLVVGKGRSGGSADNEFTVELKRILDDPQYKEVFRYNLFRNVFISASVNDQFNDLISTKLFLNWDNIRGKAEIIQTSFQAYYKSI